MDIRPGGVMLHVGDLAVSFAKLHFAASRQTSAAVE
jgi:hypothetical protein